MLVVAQGCVVRVVLERLTVCPPCACEGGDWIRSSGEPEDGHWIQEAVWLVPAGHAAALSVERSCHGSGEQIQTKQTFLEQICVPLISSIWVWTQLLKLKVLLSWWCTLESHLWVLFHPYDLLHSIHGSWFIQLTNIPTRSVPTMQRSTKEPPDTTTPARRSSLWWRSVMTSPLWCISA